jgi:acetoin utilization deacetylase AcuC-like enzyme
MKVVYARGYEADIGAHVFPTRKYGLVLARLLEAGALTPADVVTPRPATWEELGLVHASGYLVKLQEGRLSLGEIAQLELPWTPEAVEAFRLMAGGTVEATRLAIRHGMAVHLGGGLHHAHPGHGEGFCMFHDVAVAIRVAQRAGWARRVAVVDCDVHHGNGTAAIFRGDADVFTFSMHQEHNYPAHKPRGSLDLDLPDGMGDADYLRALEGALPKILAHEPQLAFYLAGADPYLDDQLGGLALTLDGLRARDRLVLRSLRAEGIPTVVTLAGGYARRVEDTVTIHQTTVEEALAAAPGA